ncbi:hypothetical protein AURDEDRAFT_163825 [Auricularia subglabra TFB-10046 SS5]|nr:hypothetical protein AURDEDRAFT_163825 [Auricularia subglabra TFB-10046 SS5]
MPALRVCACAADVALLRPAPPVLSIDAVCMSTVWTMRTSPWFSPAPTMPTRLPKARVFRQPASVVFRNVEHTACDPPLPAFPPPVHVLSRRQPLNQHQATTIPDVISHVLSRRPSLIVDPLPPSLSLSHWHHAHYPTCLSANGRLRNDSVGALGPCHLEIRGWPRAPVLEFWYYCGDNGLRGVGRVPWL